MEQNAVNNLFMLQTITIIVKVYYLANRSNEGTRGIQRSIISTNRRYGHYTLETVQTLTINPIRKKMSFNVVFLKAGLDKIKQI